MPDRQCRRLDVRLPVLGLLNGAVPCRHPGRQSGGILVLTFHGGDGLIRPRRYGRSGSGKPQDGIERDAASRRSEL